MPLSEASGKEIAKLMASWTEKMGFPMVTVTSHQNQNNRILTLTQKRFIADGSPDEKNQEWVIPISVRTSKKSSKLAKDFVLDSKTSKIVLEDVSEDDWIKVNVNSVGFYRTQYPSEMLNVLQQPISAKVLPPLDRLGVIDDLFAMVQAGYSSTVDVLRFLKSYEDETNYTVWASIHNITAQINQLVSHTSFQPLYQTFIRRILAKIFIETGWDSKPNENHLDTLLRSLVLQRLGTYGDESVFEEAKKRFVAHVNGTQKIPADLRSAVYRTVMSHDSETYFTQMLQGGNLFARLITSITENYASEEMASEVEEFFKDKQIMGTERSIQQAVECIRLNSAWLKRDAESGFKRYR
ncbi:Puromycin-sensitive aminopeptidase [Armadillidium nasatum]|uniref:Puromycin-sensitive aminopeptidase n=1 Tax=Armadillidium nasatum TaxID=96803 RepID=A0A5N5SM78_9CRUS|nr:Puromycin-sensitive aminopeptidase [Armadillidium nasatum]